MNEEQRTKKVMSVYAADIEDLYSLKDNQGVNQTCFVRCDKGNEDPNGVPNELLVTATAMKDALDLHIAEQLWKKAERLLSLGDAILPAPSTDKSSEAFSVLSQSGDSPNFAKVYNNAKVTCNCRNYKPKKICAHAISVAESLGILSEFVAWYRKQKVPTNLTSVATLDTNVKASGQKQGAAKREQKPKDAVLQYEASLLLHSASVSSPQAFPSTFSCVNSPVPVPRVRDYQKFLFPLMSRYHQSLIPQVIHCLHSPFIRIIHCCQSLIPRVIHRCQSLIPRVIHRCQSLIPRVIHRCQSLSPQVIRCHQSLLRIRTLLFLRVRHYHRSQQFPTRRPLTF